MITIAQIVDVRYVGLGALGAFSFFLLGYFLRKFSASKRLRTAEHKANAILEEVKKEVTNRRKEIDLEAKELLHKMRIEFEKESKERKQELGGLERRLVQKEGNLDRKVDLIDRKERGITDRDTKLIASEKDFSTNTVYK